MSLNWISRGWSGDTVIHIQAIDGGGGGGLNEYFFSVIYN